MPYRGRNLAPPHRSADRWCHLQHRAPRPPWGLAPDVYLSKISVHYLFFENQRKNIKKIRVDLTAGLLWVWAENCLDVCPPGTLQPASWSRAPSAAKPTPSAIGPPPREPAVPAAGRPTRIPGAAPHIPEHTHRFDSHLNLRSLIGRATAAAAASHGNRVPRVRYAAAPSLPPPNPRLDYKPL
jgi:hypothetical protein